MRREEGCSRNEERERIVGKKDDEPHRRGHTAQLCSSPLFVACWLKYIRFPKWPGRSLSFQFNGECMLCLRQKVPPPPKKQAIRPTDFRSLKQKAKTFQVGNISLELILCGTILISTPYSWISESWLWEKLRHILGADSKHILPLEQPSPSPPGNVTWLPS